MMGILRWVSVIAVLALAACASQPVHFYTLVPSDAGTPAAGAAAYSVDVLPVDVPVQVDRPELVVRQGRDGVAILDGERWAAPLSEELRTALSAELTRRLGTQNVAGLRGSGGKPVLKVKVVVRRFEAVPANFVLVVADWRLDMQNADDRALHLLCHSRLRVPTGGAYADVVGGFRTAVADLGAQIVAATKGLGSAQGAVCPDAFR